MVVEEIPILKDIIADNQALIDDMTDKLNAIKTHITHQNPSTYGLDLRKFTRVSINPKDFHSFIGDLEKILDGSYFTTIYEPTETKK